MHPPPHHPSQPGAPTPGLRPPRFYIAAIRRSFGAEELVARPLLVRLAAEDAAWRFAVDDWARRRPPWWRLREARTWSREGDALVAERVRMKAAARAAGLSG